jgi:hypothetical protein
MTFIETQQAFMQHIKDPDNTVFAGGIEDRRLKIYRELFFNNIMGFLDSGFPVLKSLYNEESWQALGRKFFIEHSCRSPFFVDISKEFVEYLSNEYSMSDTDPVFMQELAHYEWLELDVSIRKSTQVFQPWDGLSAVPQVQVSELATLVSYQYPVHQISEDFQPTEAGEPVYLVIYRDTENEVQFTLVNAVSAHLLNSILQLQTASIQQLTEIMISALPQLSSQQINDSLRPVIDQLLNQQILFPAL